MGTGQVTLNPETIDWQSDDNVLLLNSRWPQGETQSLQEVTAAVSQKRTLQGHVWLATSGSTSESLNHIKLVALSKKAFLSSATAVNAHLQISNGDTWLQVLPRFHVGGLGVEVRAQLSKSRVISDLEKWETSRVHQRIADEKVTVASMVPTQVFDLVQAQLKCPFSLRAVIVGGGALNPSLYREARKLGWPLLPSYGMTETCSQIATASLQSLQSPEMPLAQKLSHVEWRATTEGLLQIKADSLLTCYGQRQKDGSIRDWDPKLEGWLTTEDFVTLQGDGIRFMGRKNDFIKIGGEASSMTRLREIFEKVRPTASGPAYLVDAPSDRLGTEIHLVASVGIDKEMLSQWRDNFNQDVLPFERIRKVKYVSSIPLSDLGKVLWTQLKKELYGH